MVQTEPETCFSLLNYKYLNSTYMFLGIADIKLLGFVCGLPSGIPYVLDYLNGGGGYLQLDLVDPAFI